MKQGKNINVKKGHANNFYGDATENGGVVYVMATPCRLFRVPTEYRGNNKVMKIVFC